MVEPGIARANEGITMVDDVQIGEGIHPEVHVPPFGPQVRCRSDLARPEPRARPVRDHLVHRRSHDGHVDSSKLIGIPDEWGLLERLDPGERRLARTA
jgi:hypothetical protein